MFDDDENDNDVDFHDVLRRFESRLEQNSSVFIEEVEFVNIIGYYLDEFEFEKAKTALDIALNMYPNSFDLQIREAEFLMYNNMREQALEKLDHLEAIYPINSEILFHRAQCLYSMGKKDIAKEIIQKSLNYCSYNTAEYTLQVAKFLMSVGEYTEAIKYFMIVLAETPDDNDIVWYIAICYDYLGNLKSSIEYYHKYIDSSPFNENAWIQLGNVYKTDNQLDNALEAYDFALAISPTDNEALNLKTELLIDLNRTDEVIEMYEYLIKTYPLDVTLLLNFGNFYCETKQSSEAEKQFKKAIEVAPNNATTYHQLGNFYLNEDRVDKAIHYLKRATEFKADGFIYFMDLGRAYIINNDELNAVKAFKRAIEIYPDIPDGYVMVANTLINENDNEGALLMIEKIEIQFPRDPLVKIIKSLVLYNLSCIPELIEVLCAAKKIDSNALDIFDELVVPEESFEEIKKIFNQIP